MVCFLSKGRDKKNLVNYFKITFYRTKNDLPFWTKNDLPFWTREGPRSCQKIVFTQPPRGQSLQSLTTTSTHTKEGRVKAVWCKLKIQCCNLGSQKAWSPARINKCCAHYKANLHCGVSPKWIKGYKWLQLYERKVLE